MNAILRLVGNLNESADLNLQKYAWQFGTTDFKKAIDEVFKRAKVVNYQKSSVPLFIYHGRRRGCRITNVKQR